MAERANIHVAKLNFQDIKALLLLLEAMGKVDAAMSAKKRAESMIDNSSHLLALAIINEEAVGYVWAQNYGAHLRTGEITARLHDLFVLPDHRGRKVGEQLFQFMIEWAKSSQVKYLQWQSSKDAIPFYASLGLKEDTKSDLEQHPFYEIEFKP